MNNDQNNTPPRPPQSRIGLEGDGAARNLAGIAPAVVDAFLNANAKKKPVAPPPEPEPVAAPLGACRPDSLGKFPAFDVAAVKQRQLAIRELAAKMARPIAVPGAADPGAADPGVSPDAAGAPEGAAPPDSSSSPDSSSPPTSPPQAPPTGPGLAAPGGPADDLRAKHLAMRKPTPGPGRPNPGTGRLTGPPPRGTGALPELPRRASGALPDLSKSGPGMSDIRLQHLAMRQQGRNRGSGQLDGGDAGARLERMVESALGIDGAIALRQTIEALDDKGMSNRLNVLTDRVIELTPGHEGMTRLGMDVGKRMLVNNLNPMLALSVAAKESAEKIDTLKKWNDLSTKERMAVTAGLSANLAEILGAVTPPPVNFGAQIAAAGLTLVSLATDHSDAIEDVATKAANADSTRKVANEFSERGAVIAHQVRAAWDDLGERIKTGKKLTPRAPKQLQQLFDSPRFKKLKKSPTTRALAEGFENLTYNLTKKWDAQKASWSHRFRRRDD